MATDLDTIYLLTSQDLRSKGLFRITLHLLT